MKECKRHKFRVGSGIGALINGKLERIGLNIWCEKCNKKLIAQYYSKESLNFKFNRKKYK